MKEDKKPYDRVKGERQASSLTFVKMDGHKPGFPYSAVTWWEEIPEDSSLEIECGFIGKKITIEGRNLSVLLDDIRNYKVSKIPIRPNNEDDTNKWDCWIDKVTIEKMEG